MPDSRAGSWYQLLTNNAYRRNAARHELSAANLELGQILLRGKEAGESMSGMAGTAQVSRETAHKLLREARDNAEYIEEEIDNA